MSFLDDIENDINNELISNDSSSKLYGFYDIMDVHTSDEFIQYIIDISCIKELYNIIRHNKPLKSIEQFNNDSYTYDFDEENNSYYVNPVNEGVNLHIRVINYNKNTDKTISVGILNMGIYFYLSEITIVYNKIISLKEYVIETLFDKLKMAFGVINDNFLKHIHYKINYSDRKIVYPNPHFKNIVNKDFILMVLNNTIPEISYVISLCVYLMKQSPTLYTKLTQFMYNYITVYRFVSYKPVNAYILNDNEKLLLDIMKKYDIFSHINFYDFYASILTA